MFDAPLDTTYVWLGLTTVGIGLLALAAAVPTTPPPDANRVAGTIDRVAVADSPATATAAVAADAVRFTTDAVVVRNERATSRARLAFGPVVPVADDQLERVARGAPPPGVFADQSSFRQAVRSADADWQQGSTVHVAHVSWGTDVTLVTLA